MKYPENLREFDKTFKDDESCLRFLEKIRWQDGFECQACGSDKYWLISTGLRKCSFCHFVNSVKVGTIYESSRLPLKTWFYAICVDDITKDWCQCFKFAEKSWARQL